MAWRGAVIVAVLAFIALLVYGVLSKGTSDRVDQALADGRPFPAPGFDLPVLSKGELPAKLERRLGPALADGRLSLAELRGTPFVFNLWASWCTPCRSEAKLLERAWQVAGRRGVAFVGLDIQDVEDDGLGFLREFGITYPSVAEHDREVADEYGATGLPETFFVDRRGRIVGHVVGEVTAQQLTAGVAAAASGNVAGTVTGGEQRDR